MWLDKLYQNIVWIIITITSLFFSYFHFFNITIFSPNTGKYVPEKTLCIWTLFTQCEWFRIPFIAFLKIFEQSDTRNATVQISSKFSFHLLQCTTSLFHLLNVAESSKSHHQVILCKIDFLQSNKLNQKNHIIHTFSVRPAQVITKCESGA